MQARDVLASVPFFAEVLDGRGLDRLAARATPVERPKGATLIREDDGGTSMFVIVSGTVDVATGTGHAKHHVATLGPRDVVGEMSLFTGARRSATVTATEPLTAIEITREALAPSFAASPELVDRFAAILERRQAELDRLYGAGRISLFGAGTGDFGGLIRGFFGGAI